MSMQLSQKAEWTAAYLRGRLMHDLPDSAFLFIEPGGQLDAESKTVPRALRHFPYRGEDGAISAELLRGAPRDISGSSALDIEAKTVLGTRSRLMLNALDLGQPAEPLEVAEWKSGAAIQVRALGYALADIAETIAAEHKAMTLLGTDTKANGRLRADVRAKLTGLAGDLSRIVRQAELIDAEQDGAAQIALNRSQLQLLEV